MMIRFRKRLSKFIRLLIYSLSTFVQKYKGSIQYKQKYIILQGFWQQKLSCVSNNIIIIQIPTKKMLQKIFQTLLRKYFGEFLTGLENTELAFWTGKISLHNISLKHQKINQILKEKNIPFSIKYSHIGLLQIDIPWKSLSSTPVEIKIQKVYIVLKMQKIFSVTKNIENEKLSLIKNYFEHLITKILQNQKVNSNQNQGGYMQKMAVKIIHNLNADVRDISIRIVDDQYTKQLNLNKNDNIQSFQSASQNSSIVSSVKPLTQMNELPRRQSSTASQKLRKYGEKSFAFGFCVQYFNIETVDENNNKTFYNLDNKKSAVRKIISLKQISAYLEEETVCQIFKISEQKKIQLLHDVILREKHRLLAIDGKIIMNKNIQKNEFFDYFFNMNLDILEVKSTYKQLKEIMKIVATFKNASQTKQIKKLSQVDEAQQQVMKPQFVKIFPKLYSKNFANELVDENLGKLLCSVSKKNLLSWTRECAVDIIKNKKVDMVKKQKNKKGWLSYIISQAQVQLSEQQINQIYEEVQQIIKSIEYNKKLSIGVELLFSKIIFILSHENLMEEISFELIKTQLKYMNSVNDEMHILLSIFDTCLQYSNKKDAINLPLLHCGSGKKDKFVFLEFRKQKNERKVNLQISQVEMNHQMKVLLLIHQILKLKAKQQMKSDAKLKKIQLSQNRNISDQLAKNYKINVNISKLSLRIEVNDINHLLITLDSIVINTDQSNRLHNGKIQSFTISYINEHRKSKNAPQQINYILKDFTIFFTVSMHFNQIYTKIQFIELNINEADLHNIYRSLIRQAHLFKIQKVGQKNQIIHQNAYFKGHLRLLNVMKTWKDYEGVLTDEGLFFFEEQVFNQKQQNQAQNHEKYSHMIPINNLIVTVINQQQFKLESHHINELIECSKTQLAKWVDYIEKIVFENSSKAKMYKLIDKDEPKEEAKQNILPKYETQVRFQFQKIEILISENRHKNLMKIECSSLIVALTENGINFERNIILQTLQITKLDSNLPQSELNILISNKKGKEIKPLNVKIEGKKKLHPEYRGQLEVNAVIPYLKINFDPQFIYRMIKKIAWGHQIPAYTKQTRNIKVLEMVKQFLRSYIYEKRENELNSKSCKILDRIQEYADIKRYRDLGHTCLVLLALAIQVQQLQINLINGLNNLCAFHAESLNNKIQIDKGSQFLFFKMTASKTELFDTTGYPNTNTKPFQIGNIYPILKRKQQPITQQGLQICFSRFDLDRFINKSRIKSFFFFNLYDVHLNFQNQVFNRFIDYLLNQIIGFILAPNSLHKYDGPRRGPYMYDNNICMKQQEIKQIIIDGLQPFFTKIMINAYNVTATFNSFPNQQGIDLNIDVLRIETYNFEKSQKIRFNTVQLGKIQKLPIYKELIKIPDFQNKLLKSHWASQMDIIAQGITSIIFQKQVPKISTSVQRTINVEKEILFPFIILDTPLICESLVKNLSIKAPKDIYNLINKCIMHNLSYDDQQDANYTHNYRFRHLMKVSELFYRLKAQQLQVMVKQIKTVVAIPDFEFKFIRNPNLVKQMIVEGRFINIFRGSDVIMMPTEVKDKNYMDLNGLQYKIQMRLNGEKHMTVKVRNVDILYNLPFFLQFGQYTVLDQSCYPPLPQGTLINNLPDLPLIACRVQLINSRIKLVVPDANEDQFLIGGYINFNWIRNSSLHPEKYANNPQNFPQGKEWCSYKIQLKDMNIRKHYKYNRGSVEQSGFKGSQKSRFRSLSNKISIVLKISQIMKLASNKIDRYNDMIFQLKVHSLGIKLCYLDIDQLKSVFVNKKPQPANPERKTYIDKKIQKDIMVEQQSESEIIAKAPSQAQINKAVTYVAYKKYSIDVNLIEIQLGLSELPVPLIGLALKNSKFGIQMHGQNMSGTLKACIMANCWNMLIGRWEPIIEDLSPSFNFKLGKDKYLLLDCTEMILLNISLESLKILKLISSDFKQQGKFSISEINTSQKNKEVNAERKVKGINVSPYVLTNRTGLSISVWNDQTNTTIQLRPQQKTYIELKNYDMDVTEKLRISYQFDDNPVKHQVDMDLATSKKIIVQYKKREYELLLKPISNSIMKEIVVSSLFVIENKTSYGLAFYYNCGQDEDEKNFYEGKIKIMPKQKTALKFTANILNSNAKGVQKNLRLDFPELQQLGVQNNCEFPYEALINNYQHQIEMNKNKTFNCVVSINQEIEKTIVVEPSIYIKNLLPIDVLVEFAVERKDEKIIISNQLDVNQEKDIYDLGSKQNIQIRLKLKGFNISPFQILSNPQGNGQLTCNLDLIDYRGHAGKVSMKIVKKGKVRRMYIYAEAVLINETQYDFYVFSGSKLIPGQKLQNIAEYESKYIFITASEFQSINFGLNQQNPFNSNEVKLSELGIHDMSMYKGSVLYQFILKTNFHSLDNKANIYSYVLKAEPKYIMINETSFTLQITQQNAQTKYQLIKPGERLNWVWPIRTQSKKIIMRTIENEIQVQNLQWNFSSPLKISEEDLEECVIVLRPKDPTLLDKKLLKITPIRQNSSLYILVQQVNKIEDYLVTINNELQFCKLRICQQCIDNKDPEWNENKFFEFDPKSSGPVGWDFPMEKQNLVVQISFVSYLRTKYDPQKVIISLNQQKVQQVVITNQDDEFFEIEVKIEIIGIRKKITFSKPQGVEEEDPQLELMHVGNRFAFSFTQIGISVITSVKKRAEMLYLNFRKVEVIMMEKKISRSLQVKIKYINIDNNYNHNTIYPILLTPLKHHKTLNKSRPFFVLLLQQTLQNKDIVQIRELRICNEPLCIKIHDQILTAVFEMIEELNKETDKSEGRIDLLSIFRANSQFLEWEEQRLVKPQRDIFFREFEIGKLQIQITFSIRPKLNTNNFIIMTILSSFGAAISNVSEAQLTLSRFLKKDKGLSELKAELGNFYFKQFMKGIYKVLGSINLFGNPYVFIRMLSQGAWEIVNQPTQGFIKGPIQGAIGIAKGGIFFTRNVVAGTCNSFEAISQSISRGVSYMTMDEKFIERREKIKIQKSNHLLTGLKYGAFSVYTGIQVALTGLVRHPMEGYVSNGFLGGVTGTLKGVAGLITKPISGTFEGISKLSEGIKNTALLFQDGPNSKRVRPPRIFISDLAYYKNYNIYESTAISILEYSSTKYLYEQLNFISLVWLQQRKYIDAYILTTRFFTHVDIISKKLIREIEIANIKQVKLDGESLHIITNREDVLIEDGNYNELFEAFNKFYGSNTA